MLKCVIMGTSQKQQAVRNITKHKNYIKFLLRHYEGEELEIYPDEYNGQNKISNKETGRGRKLTDKLSYEQAQKVVKEFGIKTSTEYYELYRARKLPDGMPSDPHYFYSKSKRKKDGDV